MPAAPLYAEHLAELRYAVAHPAPGIILVRFATLPQLHGIIEELRALDRDRLVIELAYDPPRENAAQLIARAREVLPKKSGMELPLLVVHPRELPDTAADNAAAAD